MSFKNTWADIKNQYNYSEPLSISLLIFAFDCLLFGFSLYTFIHSPSLATYILTLFCLSFTFIHFYLFLHESTHHAMSSIKWINDLCGHICGFIICLPFLPRQTSHILHHVWTGHPVKDPANNRMIQAFSVMTDQQEKKLEFIWKFWIPALALNDRLGLWKSPYKDYKNGLRNRKNKIHLFWNIIYFLGYASFVGLLISKNIFLLTITAYVPALIICFFIEELVNLPHHAETPLLKATDKALPFWEQQAVTHSCESVPVWSKYVLLHFNLHIPHHMFPDAPWYKLSSIQNRLEKENILKSENTRNEMGWSLVNRKRPLLTIMGHYFDKTTKSLIN